MLQSLPEHYPILVVDDHPTNRQVLTLLLKSLGLESTAVASGHEAVIAVAENVYGAILMDVMMPIMDGYETTKLIRADEFGSGRHVPIIAVTALNLDEARDHCLAAGMDDFIAKPVVRDVLRDRLERWLQMPVAQLLAEFRSSLEGAPLSNNPINRERLRLLYGTDQLDGVLEVFLTATEALLLDLKTAIHHKDSAEAGRVAHELKGSAFAVSADQFSELARSLEQAARSGDWTVALKFYGDLAISFVALQQELARIASRLP